MRHLILFLFVALAAIAMCYGFVIHRQQLQHFCSSVPSGMTTTDLKATSKSSGFRFVDPPDGDAFISGDATYLPFHFMACNLSFDSFPRYNSKIQSHEFRESFMQPMFWGYDFPTSAPFFVFLLGGNLLVFLSRGRFATTVGFVGVAINLAFLLLVVDHNNGRISPITGYDSFRFLEYFGYGALSCTALSMLVALFKASEPRRGLA